MPRSKVRVAGHSLHPMLVAFPLGLLGISVVWDLAYLASHNPMWGQIAYWTILAGIIAAVVAAVPGFIDWLAIPERTRAKSVGIVHLGLNLLVLFLFVVSATWRKVAGYENPLLGAMVIGWIGIVLAVVSGWFGGELVERLGMSVWPDAGLDAPSSLRGARPTPPFGTPIPPTPAERRGAPPVGPREPTPQVP